MTTIEPVYRAAGDLDRPMPHRLLNLLPHAFPNPLTWLAGMFCATGSAVLAVWTPEKAAAIALALLAFASQLAGPIARAYKWVRQAKREEDIADLKATSQEVTRISEELGDTRSQLKAALAKIDEMERVQGKVVEVVKPLRKEVKALAGKSESNAERIAAVEAHQGSSSGLGLPAQPPEPQ